MTIKASRKNKETKELSKWIEDRRIKVADGEQFESLIARKLGAHINNDLAEFVFWTPELLENDIKAEDIYLEVFNPLTPIDFQKNDQQIEFERTLIKMTQVGEFICLVTSGLIAGTRETTGSFYWVKYIDKEGNWYHINDPVPYSLPFGVFAPAELYDIKKMQNERKDKKYFEQLKGVGRKNDLVKLGPPLNLLQIHTNTATEEGSLRELTKVYQKISDKLREGIELEAFEQNFIGYDAIQLLPIEPTIEYEGGEGFWNIWNETDPKSEEVLIDLKKPNMTNWGYDIVIAGMSTTNPCVLGSKRPDELIDFIATLHNFSTGPIRILFDVVYGHSDNQGLGILNHHFFAGPNMYGQNMNFKHEQVRRIMLEMQRRKGDYGIDALRVDGAQDFKYYDEETQILHHDDDYLQSMSDVVQYVAGKEYYPWMIFEDGRPWPRQDWELASSYRSVIEKQPDINQWGPLTFAHNTPFLYTFWITRWWRVRETMEIGSNWVTGCSNHDTVRRGTQVDIEERINDKLGQSLPEILDNAYDNPAEKILTYGMFPGQPMDFLNATMRAPWSFIRNTDDKYGVKVVAEEKRFLDWQVSEASYDDDRHFRKLKNFGFTNRSGLYYFMHILESAVALTNYDLELMVTIMNATPNLEGPTLTVEVLKQIAKAWMDDVHEYSNCSHYIHNQKKDLTSFNLALRNFRLNRPWLMNNLTLEDHYDYKYPTDGTVLYYGLRTSPDGREQVLFVANMEGIPLTIIPTELPIPNLAEDGWELALAAPTMGDVKAKDEVTFNNSEGALFIRRIV